MAMLKCTTRKVYVGDDEDGNPIWEDAFEDCGSSDCPTSVFYNPDNGDDE